MESELFGHERGAFTGAYTKKLGKFELAIGGTLFFGEIPSLRVDLQPKLMRALQDCTVDRLGGTAGSRSTCASSRPPPSTSAWLSRSDGSARTSSTA